MSLIALALAATLSTGALDPAAENEADLRCIVLIASVMATADEDGKSALTGGMLYFIGRVEGRDPKYDLESNFMRLSKRPASELSGDSDRCAKIMSDTGAMLSNMGKSRN